MDDGYERDEEGYFIDPDSGDQIGYCNSCGEEATTAQECCEDNERLYRENADLRAKLAAVRAQLDEDSRYTPGEVDEMFAGDRETDEILADFEAMGAIREAQAEEQS